ncbi:MAG: TlpA disulfide reductase family protein [Bacteroidota bacterium]|jgi:peroxiredoxin|nr:TlpA disulfide reductase family protein [Bacteroidota bacterium]
MNRSIISFLLLVALTATLHAQSGPVAGRPYTVTYVPPPDSPFASAKELTLIHTFDYWNVRYGTRLALWQNVLRPDTGRVRFARLEKGPGGWRATIDIPETAALLSYIIGDGTTIDGNHERTFTSYVYDAEGRPVRNARFYNIPFLRLAREDLGRIVQEAEREIIEYPENFPAYHQYFKLLLEQARGNTRTQQRIATRIDELEQRFGGNYEFMNMAAETWYYVLQDQEKGLAYREKIPPNAQWPQVFRMYDRGTKEEELRQRALHAEQQRTRLINTELPAFNLHDRDDRKVAFPQKDGKVRIFVFWASTSANSGQMLEGLRDIAATRPRDAFEVVAVSVDPDETKAFEHFSGHSYPFVLLFNQGATLLRLGVDSIPTTFVVDGTGIVRDTQVGFSPATVTAIRKTVDDLLR